MATTADGYEFVAVVVRFGAEEAGWVMISARELSATGT